MNTKNCCFGSTFTVPEWGFKIKGFSLSVIEDFIKSPGLSQREYYCGLYRGIRTSEVTALLTTNLTIFIEQEVSSSIFLHIILGISILKFNLILFYLPDYYTINQPLNQVDWVTYFGQHPTKICIFLLGFNTIFNFYMHQLLPYLSKKNPLLRDLFVKDKVKKTGQVDVNANTASPQWPGKTVPRSSNLGSLRFFIIQIFQSFINIEQIKLVHKRLTLKQLSGSSLSHSYKLDQSYFSSFLSNSSQNYLQKSLAFTLITNYSFTIVCYLFSLAQSQMKSCTDIYFSYSSIRWPCISSQSGYQQQSKSRQYYKMLRNSIGMLEHSSEEDIFIFLSNISLYLFSAFVVRLFCHGNLPNRKQMIIQQIDQRSSLLLCQILRWEHMLAQRRVPLKSRYYLQGLWRFTLESLKRLLNPKSIKQSTDDFAPQPMRKFSGLMSLQIYPFECKNQILSNQINFYFYNLHCQNKGCFQTKFSSTHFHQLIEIWPQEFHSQIVTSFLNQFFCTFKAMLIYLWKAQRIFIIFEISQYLNFVGQLSCPTCKLLLNLNRNHFRSRGMFI